MPTEVQLNRSRPQSQGEFGGAVTAETKPVDEQGMGEEKGDRE